MTLAFHSIPDLFYKGRPHEIFLKPTEDHETLVDVVGLLQGLALAARLLGHLAAGQVNKVDFAVSRYVHTLHNLCTIEEGRAAKSSLKIWLFSFYFPARSWKPLPKNRRNKDKSS
jgi:hypothetical protein